jgi:hypothetical protein
MYENNKNLLHKNYIMEMLTTVEVNKKLNIPSLFLYYLINRGKIYSPDKKSNRTVWTLRLIDQLRNIVNQKYISKNQKIILSCKTAGINNRRYLGNKYKLLPYLNTIESFEKFHNQVINIPRDSFSDRNLKKLQVWSSYLLLIEEIFPKNGTNYLKMIELISQQIKNWNFPKQYRDKKDVEIRYFKFDNNIKNHY